jgi:flagellar biosynthesis/type III secretory pathway chaperone
MLLHQQLLECLEQERLALAAADEEAIISLAAVKGNLLEQLQHLAQEKLEGPAAPEDEALLASLKRRLAAAHRRNHALIGASLEVIQDFLKQLQPREAGIYGPPAPARGASPLPLFQRQA